MGALVRRKEGQEISRLLVERLAERHKHPLPDANGLVGNIAAMMQPMARWAKRD